MYNKPNGDVFDQNAMQILFSFDELIEQNSNTVSGSVSFSYKQSIYRYYSINKASVYNKNRRTTNINYHSIRPVFLFKE